MSDRPEESGPRPPHEEIASSLESCGIVGGGAYGIASVEDISKGISGSSVRRVFIERTSSGEDPFSLVLKIPGWRDESRVGREDALSGERERLFFESGLPDRLPEGLRTPAVLGVERRGGRTWIWTEDVGGWLGARWLEDEAHEAARRCALLHSAYRTAEAELSEAGWLGRREYSSYAHHVPSAHLNLERAASDPELDDLFSRGERARLHECLDLHGRVAGAMDGLPRTLIHGDFHGSNLGFDDGGTLVVLDWAHVGLAPPGCDVATFVSVYRLFGGVPWTGGRGWEDELVGAYTEAMRESGEPKEIEAVVRTAVGFWHLTWGLHLRLGPGLGALLGRHVDDGRRPGTIADVREGCERALAALATATRA